MCKIVRPPKGEVSQYYEINKKKSTVLLVLYYTSIIPV